MSPDIGGQRPCPRVALLGVFDQETISKFELMFPTIWAASELSGLQKKVDIREIDLIIIAPGVDYTGNWPKQAHVINFSASSDSLPGPIDGTQIYISGSAETEEFELPNIALTLSRCRNADLEGLSSVKGWPRLALSHWKPLTTEAFKKALKVIADSAIIKENITSMPLAVVYMRQDNLGVAWIPFLPINQAAWVDAIITEWAQVDTESFPNIGDWTSSSEWMVPEEEAIISEIQILEKKKEKIIAQYSQKFGELNSKLADAKAVANKGRRRLITAQGDELVEEVAKALSEIGFHVTNMDKLVNEKGQKLEDLRLQHPCDQGKDWTAIVEVRGYARSGGQTSDMQRLHRFATFYERETKRAPDKLIYIVNDQIELLPSQRQEPLVSAEKDVEVFGESNGVIIWTLDLFKTIKATDPSAYPSLIESIKKAKGRWTPAG